MTGAIAVRRYLAVIWSDLTSPFREWTWRGVGLFVVFVVCASAVIMTAMFAVWSPWYALLRYAIGYSHERAAEMAMGCMIVTGWAIMYAVSVAERAKTNN